MKQFEKFFPFFLAAGILLNFNGLLIDILEPDGALYATISKHIALTGDWVNLWGDGHDWLDKPHLPFWLSAVSFKIFGISAFAYKLPAFIFWLGGIYFTFKLAGVIYSNQVAKIASVLYVFALHGLLNNFDVRAEPYLTALGIGAIYYFYIAHLSGKWWHIAAAAVLAACAVMTKGIFVLITIGGGMVIWWMVSRQWRQFINYRWYIMLVLIAVFTIPELYCLYLQFDMHPEKIVFDKTHVSGLRFFFWDSQFGRFFNTGPIKGHGDKTFFLHTTLWAYLPWSILLYCAVVQLFRKKNDTAQTNQHQWVIYGSAAITFLLFSFSRFQLPHYIAILFPHFSIITAAYLFSLTSKKTFTAIIWLQRVLLALAIVAVSLLALYSKIGLSAGTFIIMALIALVTFIYFKEKNITTVVAFGVSLSLMLFIYLFNFFYPVLLTYQAGMVAGKQLKKQQLHVPLALYNTLSYSWEFYAPGYIETIRDTVRLNSLLQQKPEMLTFMSQKEAAKLVEEGYIIKWLATYSYFHISMVELSFLNPATRQGKTDIMGVAEIRKIAP